MLLLTTRAFRAEVCTDYGPEHPSDSASFPFGAGEYLSVVEEGDFEGAFLLRDLGWTVLPAGHYVRLL
jgi:hypothetical protein